MSTRDDSFKGLVHKLEGEGKSKHYATAIAGKVAKEKGDSQGPRGDAQGPESPERNDAVPEPSADAMRKVARIRAAYQRHLAGERRDLAGRAPKHAGRKMAEVARSLGREANRHENNAKDIEATELDEQRNDDLDPERIKHDLDEDRHEDADRAVKKSIERHNRKRIDEDTPMADKGEMRKRLDEIMSQVKDLCDELGDDGERDDAESEAERSKAGKVARRHQLETERGDAESEAERSRASEEGHEHEDERDDAMSHAEHVRIGKESHRDDEDEHEAGEELAEGHEDAEHGDKAEGEKLEHEAGEAEAEDRDHGDDDDDVREHRGDEAPEDIAESLTEADAQSSRRSVRVKRSFNNRHDSNEDRGMSRRSDDDIRRQIEVLNARLSRATRPTTYKERDELARIQRRCDSVSQALGLRTESPLVGEHPSEYRRRCAALLQPFSEQSKGVVLNRLDDATFGLVEDRIYTDAQAAARAPSESLAGKLVSVVSHDAGGRPVTKYYGDPLAWMKPYMDKPVYLKFADSQTRRNAGAKQ